MIETLSTSHVEAVTRLHLSSLTGLLRDLGYRATRAFYHGASRSPGAIGLVQIEAGSLAGFVLGAANPAKLRREVLANNLLETLLGTCLGVMRRPATFRWLLAPLGSSDKPYDTQAAELIYLAVDPSNRSSGVGRQLVEHFGNELSAVGISAYELSVDAENHIAVRFYERLGFEVVGRYREFDIDHIRYRLEFG